MYLETLLQNYFGCKKPFRKNGKLTKSGDGAVQYLICLISALSKVGIITDDVCKQAIRNIDDIIDSNHY